jgi:hypothetical protein
MIPLSIKAGNKLVLVDEVHDIDITDIEQEVVKITLYDGTVYEAHGFDAIEAIWVFGKPSALEGRRLKWKQGAWAFHNLVGHPVVQILAWCGFKHEAVRFHDWTTPKPRGFKK